MGEHTFSYQPGVPGLTAGSYWRRRCLVLVVGLSLFAMAAWSLSQALRVTPAAAGSAGASHGHGPAGGAATGGGPQTGKQSAGRHASGHRKTGHHTASSHPAGNHGAGNHRAGNHGAGNHGAGNHGAGNAGRGSGSHSAGQHGSGGTGTAPTSAGHGFGGFSPAFCSRHSIVLSLAAAQLTFGPHQAPGFSLSIVSTQRQPCSFNVGSAHLALVVKEGPVRIWSSADCASGTSGLVTALRRGVPTIVTITWHRRTSAPGCGSPARRVPPGTYTGYAVDGPVVSAPVTFKLG